MDNKLLFFLSTLFALNCGQSPTGSNQKKENFDEGEVSVTLIEHSSSKSNATDSIILIGNMNIPRAAHTATLLKNGRILLCGGFAETTLSSAEIYDPDSKSFIYTGSMTTPRAGHTATLLPDGKVLISGGFNGNYLSSTELFDPSNNSFTASASLISARSGHTATLLSDKRILLTGGVGTNWTFLESAELYDARTNLFTSTGSMSVARESHTATLLPNGSVLITGGHRGRKSDIKIYSSAELYDPSTEKFTLTGNMSKIRHKHDAVRLKNGSVLITGGSDERDSRGTYVGTEIYKPSSAKFQPANDMHYSRYKHNGTSIVLDNGNVLLAGGANRAEVYNPKTKSFTVVAGTMNTKRLFSCATYISKGKVLITGGYDENQNPSSIAWIYNYED